MVRSYFLKKLLFNATHFKPEFNLYKPKSMVLMQEILSQSDNQQIEVKMLWRNIIHEKPDSPAKPHCWMHLSHLFKYNRAKQRQVLSQGIH